MMIDDVPARFDRAESQELQLPETGPRARALYTPPDPDWLGEWGRYLPLVRRAQVACWA